MKKLNNDPASTIVTAREMTYDQLVNISNKNHNVLNQGVDPDKLNKDDKFICIPLMVHEHVFGKEFEPHLRVRVTTERNPEMYALQDMTLEQYWSGVEIELELETSN